MVAAGGHKHDMVRERIMIMLESLNVGDPIPPERVLVEDCKVSRLTVRRAVDDLVREGLLTRRQGSGTYVARPTVTQSPTASSFSLDLRRRGLMPANQIVAVERADAGAQLSWRLQVAPSDQVLVIRRLRLADGEPMAVSTTYLPDALVPDLPVDELEQRSLYRVLEDRYGLKVCAGIQTVQPTVTSPQEAEVLKVPSYSPAFLFRTTTRTGDGAVVEFTRAVYRGDRYMITAELDLGSTQDDDPSRSRALRRGAPLE